MRTSTGTWRLPPTQLTRRLVIKTLAKVQETDPDRKCFRLIGGVLAEKTVKEVLPALQMNYDGVRASQRAAHTDHAQLSQMIVQLAKQYKQKDTELQELHKSLSSS